MISMKNLMHNVKQRVQKNRAAKLINKVRNAVLVGSAFFANYALAALPTAASSTEGESGDYVGMTKSVVTDGVSLTGQIVGAIMFIGAAANLSMTLWDIVKGKKTYADLGLSVVLAGVILVIGIILLGYSSNIL